VSAQRDRKTLAWTSSTYFAEGLPWSLLHQVAAEYFTAIGLRPVAVGYTSLLHGPTLLKVVWSPLVALAGTLRGWMIATQAAMGVAVGLLAVLAHKAAESADPAASTSHIWLVLVLIGVLSATHDIACDGYYLEALDAERQARFSGARVAAFRAAMLVGASGLVFLGGQVSWLLAFGLGAALLLGLAIAHRAFLPEPRADFAETSESPKTKPRGWAHVKGAYLSFLRQDRVLLVVAFLLTYKMADVVMFAMSKVFFARELGIGTALRGGLINPVATLSSIAGAIVGGAWIAKRGLDKTLFPITLVMAVTAPLYALLAHFAPVLDMAQGGVAATPETLTWRHVVPLSLVLVTVVIEQLCGGLATAAQMVFIMRRCHPDHKAAHFAFATAVYSAAQMAVGAYSGALYEWVGPVSYFWIVTLLTLPALGLSVVVAAPARS
jgi:PAT family beta-lactamase induction signal transducer AmpG